MSVTSGLCALFFTVLGIVSSVAQAITLEEVQKAVYTNKDFMGFCTSQNENQEFKGTGLCDAIEEALEKKECTTPGATGKSFNELLEEIRLRVKGDFDKLKGTKNALDRDGKDRTQTSVTMGGKCTAWSEAAKDEKAFSGFFKQFMAVVAIEQSEWNPLKGVQSGPQQNPDQSEAKGLYMLKTSDMTKEEYACGCKNINHPDVTNAPNTQGPPPGARDSFDSTVCATYMALYHIAEDGTLYGGKRDEPADAAGGNPASGNSNKTASSRPKDRQGAAVPFPNLVSKPDPNTGEETNQKLKNLEDKFGFYCDKSQKPNGTLTDINNNVSPASMR